jgi:SAM-dependent methyltransferase
MTPPALTDRAQLLRQRVRAARAGWPVRFLHDIARAEVQDRLALVNRTFTAPAVVTGHPELWAEALPGARVIADAPVLDLAPAAHDLVVHWMALHWADDPVGQIVQCARALVPDGLFLALFPGGRTLAELRAALAEAEAALTGGLSPRVLPMGEIRDLGALPGRAGLALPVADSVRLTASYASALDLMRELRAMGEGNALAARRRRIPPRALFPAAAAAYAAAWGDAAGRITATFELIALTAWAPHPGQPRPLRPGSAAMRLAEALGTREIGLGDPARPGRD